jgi:hypothetical protein
MSFYCIFLDFWTVLFEFSITFKILTAVWFNSVLILVAIKKLVFVTFG